MKNGCGTPQPNSSPPLRRRVVDRKAADRAPLSARALRVVSHMQGWRSGRARRMLAGIAPGERSRLLSGCGRSFAVMRRCGSPMNRSTVTCICRRGKCLTPACSTGCGATVRFEGHAERSVHTVAARSGSWSPSASGRPRPIPGKLLAFRTGIALRRTAPIRTATRRSRQMPSRRWAWCEHIPCRFCRGSIARGHGRGVSPSAPASLLSVGNSLSEPPSAWITTWLAPARRCSRRRLAMSSGVP